MKLLLTIMSVLVFACTITACPLTAAYPQQVQFVPQAAPQLLTAPTCVTGTCGVQSFAAPVQSYSVQAFAAPAYGFGVQRSFGASYGATTFGAFRGGFGRGAAFQRNTLIAPRTVIQQRTSFGLFGNVRSRSTLIIR